MSECTFTLRVDESLKNDFTKLAKSQDRTAAQLVRDFMRDYIKSNSQSEYDDWFRKQIESSHQDIALAKTMTNDEVKTQMNARKQELLSK